ncbi:EamA family transporter, partial [Acinetobacter baumannii]|uniref:EamA family transporter n=1 Tax=Acinetobacter baumannii TaxID=470 RepID=UPI000ADF2C3B
SFFLLLLVINKGSQPLNWKDAPALGVLGFFAVTLHHLLINTVQQYVTAVASSIFSQSIRLFSVLMSALVFKEHFRFIQWLCILVGLSYAV